MEELRISPKLNNAIKRCFLSCAALLIGVASVLLVSGASSISLAAEDQININSLNFYAGTPYYVSGDTYYDAVVPVYANIYWDRQAKRYLSGFIVSSAAPLTFKNSAGSTISPTYFEPVEHIQGTMNSQNGWTVLVFDNLSCPLTSSFEPLLIGYYHFSFKSSANSSLIIPSGNNQNVTIYNGNLRNGDSFIGLEAALISAINSASDIDSLNAALAAIQASNDTIKNQIISSNTYLDAVSTKLSTLITAADYTNSALRKLFVMLASVVPTDPDAYVAQQFFDNMVNIFAAAMNKNNPADTGGNKADQIANGLDNLTQDMAVNKPQNIENVADSYLQSVDTELAYSSFSWLNNSVIVTMLCIVISVAGLSYLLYGKK